METFKCKNCGFEITVDWNDEISERDIPCGKCYFEEYILDEITNISTQIAHGNKIHCAKGLGL